MYTSVNVPLHVSVSKFWSVFLITCSFIVSLGNFTIPHTLYVFLRVFVRWYHSTMGFHFPLQGVQSTAEQEWNTQERWAPLFDCFEVSLKRLFDIWIVLNLMTNLSLLSSELHLSTCFPPPLFFSLSLNENTLEEKAKHFLESLRHALSLITKMDKLSSLMSKSRELFVIMG